MERMRRSKPGSEGFQGAIMTDDEALTLRVTVIGGERRALAPATAIVRRGGVDVNLLLRRLADARRRERHRHGLRRLQEAVSGGLGADASDSDRSGCRKGADVCRDQCRGSDEVQARRIARSHRHAPCRPSRGRW